ncbi:MAG: hypothetical protein CME85_14270 [Henriciella sp.]|jgi:hypothetical protein|uniref:hypothetical protein n=1 Tax=Henriciella sp. TaxID=1968823 RepID=UPI000C0C6AB7|nr:hypothetical protein [Henriciella sp.]MAN74099.1 hypothetical protein [Henriciella sp.]MBF34225.1 hypothetical protein [Hyphomonadaceae bacterium]MBK76634.1 hypothetical protein [Henriciella sp.]PHR75596.1 MAG: hypothetical protein COA64_11875 [Henriciella sp.]|tara:strand:+ start:2099 stop:2728 length:630 start_codon:yes stop_codon:yes gene_type:complete
MSILPDPPDFKLPDMTPGLSVYSTPPTGHTTVSKDIATDIGSFLLAWSDFERSISRLLEAVTDENGSNKDWRSFISYRKKHGRLNDELGLLKPRLPKTVRMLRRVFKPTLDLHIVRNVLAHGSCQVNFRDGMDAVWVQGELKGVRYEYAITSPDFRELERGLAIARCVPELALIDQRYETTSPEKSALQDFQRKHHQTLTIQPMRPLRP